MPSMRTIIGIIAAWAVVTAGFTPGAAAEPEGPGPKGAIVARGDRADVLFTCRFKSGEVAISTDQKMSADPTIPKSRIFLERDRSTPIRLFAGGDPEARSTAQQRGFESELFYRLSLAIVGMETGKAGMVEVNAPPMGDEKKGDHFLKMARVRKREKEVRMTPEEYKGRTGRTPEVGRPYVMDPTVPGKVASVTEKEVVIRFSADPGSRVATPFGEGAIKEYEDRYEIVIDARAGSLTRTGGIVGHIVRVDERFITIDYSHPFGGETLFCDVLVESSDAAARTWKPSDPSAVRGGAGGT